MFNPNPNKKHQAASSSNIPVDPQATTTSDDPVSMEQAWAALFSPTASLSNTVFTTLPKNTEDSEWAKAAEVGFGNEEEDIWNNGIKPSASAAAIAAALNALPSNLENEMNGDAAQEGVFDALLAQLTNNDRMSPEKAWIKPFLNAAALDNPVVTGLSKDTKDLNFFQDAITVGFGNEEEDIWNNGIKPSASAAATEAALDALLARLANEAKLEGRNVAPPPRAEDLPAFNETLPACKYLEKLLEDIAELRQEQDTTSPFSIPPHPSAAQAKNPEQNSALPMRAVSSSAQPAAIALWKKVHEKRKTATSMGAPHHKKTKQ